MASNRDAIVPVRLNSEELERLDNVRSDKGLSRSAYMRWAYLEQLKREKLVDVSQ